MTAYRDKSSLAQSSGTSVTLTRPSLVKRGDWLLAGLYCGSGSGLTIMPPAGWELVVRTNDGVSACLAVYRLRVTEGIASSWAWTLSISVAAVGIVADYGGADASGPVDISGGQANASSTSATAPSVTTTKSNAHLVAFWGALTGAPTATPPAGWVERADVQGAALSLSLADVRQATLGASGTKVATLSGAAQNVGVLLALAPAALNTPAEVRDEGNWSLEGWQNRLTTEAAMNAFVEGIVQRVNTSLRIAVGRDWHTANVLEEPWNEVLKEAEMHGAQAELLKAAAGIAESGSDNNPAPFFGTAKEILSAREERMAAWERLVALCRADRGASSSGLLFRTSKSTPVILERFDPDTGTDENPFDGEVS